MMRDANDMLRDEGEDGLRKYFDQAERPRNSLASAHKMFCTWLSKGYDADTIDAVLAAAAAHALGGDPLWLLVISGPGNAKTETLPVARRCRRACQLFQIVRGAEAIGLDHAAALRLAIRCDTTRRCRPSGCKSSRHRRHPDTTTPEIRSLNNRCRPSAAARRLQVLGLLSARKGAVEDQDEAQGQGQGEGKKQVWHWSLGRLLNGAGLAFCASIASPKNPTKNRVCE